MTLPAAGDCGWRVERAEGLLVEHLHDRGLQVICVSPKVSARARERYRMAAAKSDAFDSPTRCATSIGMAT
jgi:hypothetical protein